MNLGPRKRGRPKGSRTVHPDRDRLVHFMVEWVILRTDLGLGRGRNENESPHDACIVAAWLLSGGRYGRAYMDRSPNRSWLREAVEADSGVFQGQLVGVEHPEQVLDQLTRMNPRAVRDAYQRVQKAQLWRPSMRSVIERSERSRQLLANPNAAIEGGEILTDDSGPN